MPRRHAARGFALALGLSVLAGCSPEPPAPVPLAPVPPAPAPPGARAPLWLVGLDGADWAFLDRLSERGGLPELDRLEREGRAGVLRSLEPPLSPLVWTTMMTGVSPLVHRVLDFTRFSPADGEREPIGSADRRVPALWSMASAAGRPVAVFGMWATHPPEPVAGLLVSDRFFSFAAIEPRPPAGTVHPAGEEAWALALRDRVEAEVGLEVLRAYLPDLAADAYAAALARPDPYAEPVAALRRILVETRLYARLAEEALARRPAELALIYFQGTDTVGHVFAPYAPPLRDGVDARQAARFGGVAERYFAEVDAVLGRLRRLAAAKRARLLVVSDHGFRWGDDRPPGLDGREAATAGRWHRPDGIWLLWGEGIAAAPRDPAAAGVERTAATALALLGLPPGKGLAGPPFGGVAAGDRAPVDYADGWTPAAPATAAPTAGVEGLRALGYLGGGEPSRRPATTPAGLEATRTPGSFNNEGLLLRAAGREADAIVAFERALALHPAHPSSLANLADLLASRDPERADDLLVAAARAGAPDAAARILARAAVRRGEGRLERALLLLDGAVGALPAATDVRLYRGRCRLETGGCEAALADFEWVAGREPESAVVHASLGLAWLCLERPARARAAFERSLALDPAQPELAAFLARPAG